VTLELKKLWDCITASPPWSAVVRLSVPKTQKISKICRKKANKEQKTSL